MSRSIEEKGNPSSHCEVKPLNLWQRICEHHGVTRIVDFSPGSAGLAIAAAGAMEYEGVAANEIHCSWLDSTLDLVVKCLASKDKVFAKKLEATTISRRRLRNTSLGPCWRRGVILSQRLRKRLRTRTMARARRRMGMGNSRSRPTSGGLLRPCPQRSLWRALLPAVERSPA